MGSLEPEALRVHVEDALAAVPAAPPGARVVDLGTGAGFPGIPLALERRDLRVTLVEIREKRVAFLRHVARILDGAFDVKRQRIELGPASEAPFDLALMRAVAPPERSLALARPWVCDAGEIWLWTRAELPPLPHDTGPFPEPLDLADRGRILRVPAAAVPRGTI